MPLKLHKGKLVAIDDSDAPEALSLQDCLASDDATAVRLEPSDDALALADALGRITRVEVNYPAYTDGRAHSQAHLLRQRLRYTGEIRAVGDVRPDQVTMMARCGIDAFAFSDPKAEATTASAEWQAHLDRYSETYQTGYR